MSSDSAPLQGIVTLADHRYFPGLMLLYRSVQEALTAPVVCFDAGLTEEQRALASRRCPQLRILPIPDFSSLDRIKRISAAEAPRQKQDKRAWPIWICPLLIAAAPFRRVFWLDCDVVVLRNLDLLFALLDNGPVFTPENFAPEVTPNKPELYELLPIARSFDPREPRVNSGVSGWDLIRDKDTLDAYGFAVESAFEDARIHDAISWREQGALIWAIQKTGMEHRVQQTTVWNRCVIHTPLRERPVPWNDDFLASARKAVPDANLIHWNGNRVPWAQ